MGKWIKKLIVLVLVFVVAIGVFILTGRESEKKKAYNVMTQETLPLVQFVYRDRIVNELRGYTVKMDGRTMRKAWYPLEEDCLLPVKIVAKKTGVVSVEYEVRNTKNQHLVENSRTEELRQEADNVYTAQIKLMDLLDRDEEYQIMLTVNLSDGTKGYYYTNISFAGNETIQGAVDFACEFSEKTFLKEPDDMLIAQLESNASADISNLGYADIYSSYSHVLWGELHPEKKGETRITIHEIGRLITSMVLEYEMTATDDTGRRENYLVREFYCVRYVNGKYYLMTYERMAEQIFAQGQEVITRDGSLELGVVSQEELPLQIVENGNYIAYVYAGTLWCYDSKSDILGTIFTFRTEDDRYNDDHDLRIVRLEENGNMDFIVYGYMGSGEHEGESGLGYYRYLAEDDALEEMFYVSSDDSGELVRNEVGTLSHLSSSGLFYLLYGGTVYAIDLDGGEYVELVTGISAAELAFDEKNGIFAWQDQGDIRLYSLEEGTVRVLSAPAGEAFWLFGFIQGDLLYGAVRESDWEQMSRYSAQPPVYALEIVNMEGVLKRRYEQRGVFLAQVEILPDRVSFGRRMFQEGVWVNLDDDILFSSVANEEEVESALYYSSSARRKRVYYLDLGLTEKTIIRYNCPKILDKPCLEIELGRKDEHQSSLYYAYSYGKLQGVFEHAADAIACVDGALGVVVDGNMQIVWNRGNRDNSATISMPQREAMNDAKTADYLELYLRKLGVDAECDEDVAVGENVFSILNKYCDRTLLDLEGCTLSQMLYYLDQGAPVLGFANNDYPVLLVGYREVYGEITLLVHSLRTAETTEYDFDQVSSWFEASGNRFISVLP